MGTEEEEKLDKIATARGGEGAEHAERAEDLDGTLDILLNKSTPFRPGPMGPCVCSPAYGGSYGGLKAKRLYPYIKCWKNRIRRK